MSTPQAGDQAPEVALPDETGTIHRLADRSGSWTVVYFYPEDDTPGCTTEACQFRDLHDDINGLDAEIWGVSPDGSGSHAAFRAKFGLPFTLLSDEDHAVADAYGAWQERNNYGQEVLGDRAVELSSSTPTDGSPTPGRRSRPTATPPRSSRRSRRPAPSAPGWPAERVPGRARGSERGFARGGRRAKPQSRNLAQRPFRHRASQHSVPRPLVTAAPPEARNRG